MNLTKGPMSEYRLIVGYRYRRVACGIGTVLPGLVKVVPRTLHRWRWLAACNARGTFSDPPNMRLARLDKSYKTKICSVSLR